MVMRRAKDGNLRAFTDEDPATRRGAYQGKREFEKPYSDEQMEFLMAVKELKKKKPRPTDKDIFALAIKLGYRKVEKPRKPQRPK